MVRRDKPCPDSIRAAMRALGFRFVELDDDAEVSEGQAMNFVTIDAHEVIMLADRPRTQATLAAAGITSHATLHAAQLLRAAGGIGCATGILQRRLVSETR